MRTTENSRDVLKMAIGVYGRTNQITKAMEEMGELITAISRFHGAEMQDKPTEDTKALLNNVTEEIADCIIMMEQLKIIYCRNDVDRWIDYKIERLAKRLEWKPSK